MRGRSSAFAEHAVASHRPNILVLMTDQQRHDAMRCAGNRQIRTPALDALGIGMLPAQIILDRDGKVIWTSGMHSLWNGAEGVRNALNAALAATP